MPNWEVNKPSGTLTITDTLVGWGDVTYTAGTINPGTSTFYVGSTMTVGGNMTFNNLDICMYENNFEDFYITGSSNVTVLGNARLNFSECANNSANKSFNNSGTLTVHGNLSVGGTGQMNFDGGYTGTLALAGGNNQVVTWPTLGDTPNGDLVITKSGGEVTFANPLNLGLSGQDLTITSGTLNLGNQNLTVNGTFSTQLNSTVILTGDQTITAGSTSYNGSVVYTGTGSYSSLALGSTYNNLTIAGAGTYSPTGTVTVTGNFTQQTGTFNAPDNLRIGGNMTLSGGSFVPGNNTVTAIEPDTVTTIDGITSFYNFTSIMPGKEIIFEAGETYTVSNALTIRGTKKDPLTLRSSSPGTQWFISAPAGTTGEGLYVADSNACSGNRVTATDSGGNGNNDCWDFGYETGVQGWYNTSWLYRKKIIIDDSYVEGTSHTNFPLLVSLTSDTALATSALDSGNDILFTASDGTTKLDHEIETFNGTTGQLISWVRIPTLSGTAPTTLYMYYGNAAASSQQNPTGVWDSTYHAVWHLNENPAGTAPQIQDSTSNNRDGTSQGSMTLSDLVTARILTGLDFDGSNDAISVPAGAGFNNVNTGTISLRVRWNGSQPAGFSGSYGAVSGREQGGVFGNNIIGLTGSNPATAQLMWRFRNAGSNEIVSTISPGDGTWRYITVSFAPGAHRLYIDGNLDGSSSTTDSTHDNISIPFTFGAWLGVTYSNSFLDEVRLSSTNRSAEWVRTEYNNMTSTSFFSLDAQETPQVDDKIKIRGGTRIQGGTRLETD